MTLMLQMTVEDGQTYRFVKRRKIALLGEVGRCPVVPTGRDICKWPKLSMSWR